MIDLTTIVRPTFEPTAEPSPVAVVPATGGTTLITEQQVLFSTAAAVALPRAKPSRWAMAIKSVSSADEHTVHRLPTAGTALPGQALCLPGERSDVAGDEPALISWPTAPG